MFAFVSRTRFAARAGLLLVLALAGARAAQGQQPPSPAEVLGYALGERFTDHASVVRYLEALAASSPRVRVTRYGETAEGRPLLQVVIVREDYHSRLEEMLARNRELTDPTTAESRARAIAAANPAVVYFSYGVHGNESSSSEAALWTAWDLARGAESVAGVLDSVVVIIDPAVNPDGRDRYVSWYRQALGRRPNPNPESREHWEPWPGGRFNHYLFDLNRDWAWLTQPETKARLATWSRWAPQVHVDFHEMDFTSSYFFFPATPPINPLYPEHILDWGRYFGAANAAAFDQHGWAYYTAESFDLFYPGYGDSWPSLVGAIGMTYEQAGHARAGLAVKRPDGRTLTLRDRAEHHRTSGEATLRAAAHRKSELLLDFARFYRTVDNGLPDILIVPGADPQRVAALAQLLRGQGIVVERAARAFRADAQAHQGFRARRDFPAGTLLVRARQPRGRLAITLLQPETMLDAEFSYDVAAWSLPYAYGVEAHRIERAPDAGWERVADADVVAGGADGRGDTGTRGRGDDSLTASPRPPLPASGRGASAEPYGFLIRPGFGAWPGIVKYLEGGGRVVVLDEGFKLDGDEWPAGTLFLPRDGAEDVAQKLDESGLAALAVAVRSGLTSEGNDLGTEEAYTLELPRVALLTGTGTSPTSFGAHWFFLENTLGIAFDALPIDQLGSVRLERYDVIIVPELGSRALMERNLELLKGWTQRGGTLIAVGSGAEAVGDSVAEIKVRKEKPDEEKKDEDKEERLERALRGREARERDRWEEDIPGTILTATLDAEHPLGFGAGADATDAQMFVLQRGGRVFEPAETFESVAYFAGPLEKVSGVISEKNLERLARGTWLAFRRVERGRVILFADDPLFRHFWYAGFQPYTNALLIGPRL